MIRVINAMTVKQNCEGYAKYEAQKIEEGELQSMFETHCKGILNGVSQFDKKLFCHSSD